MCREELNKDVLNLSDELYLTEKNDEYLSKYGKLHSALQLARNCNSHLMQVIIELERNAVTNSQYHIQKEIELNPVSGVWRTKFWKKMSVKPFPSQELMVRSLMMSPHEKTKFCNY